MKTYSLKHNQVLLSKTEWDCFDIAFSELRFPAVPSKKLITLRQAVAWLVKNHGNIEHMHPRASESAWFYKLPVEFFRDNFGPYETPPGPLKPYITRVVKWSRVERAPSGWALTDAGKAQLRIFRDMLARGAKSQLTIDT